MRVTYYTGRRCLACDHLREDHDENGICRHDYCECFELDLGPVHTCERPPPAPVQGCEIPKHLIPAYERALMREKREAMLEMRMASAPMRWRQFTRSLNPGKPQGRSLLFPT